MSESVVHVFVPGLYAESSANLKRYPDSVVPRLSVEPTIVELIVVVFAVIVEPMRVEKLPFSVENEDTYIDDWIVRVDLISISFAVYCWPVNDENVRL
jgi:hypothetical protein